MKTTGLSLDEIVNNLLADELTCFRPDYDDETSRTRSVVGNSRTEQALREPFERRVARCRQHGCKLELPPASTLSDNLNAMSNQTRSLIHQAQFRVQTNLS
jgi:hypothetical protein